MSATYILEEVAKWLGVEDEYFNARLKLDIEAAMYACTDQGCPEPTDPEFTTWTDWLGTDPKYSSDRYPIQLIKDAVTTGAGLTFDPPKNQTVMKFMESHRNEMLHRIHTAIESITL